MRSSYLEYELPPVPRDESPLLLDVYDDMNGILVSFCQTLVLFCPLGLITCVVTLIWAYGVSLCSCLVGVKKNLAICWSYVFLLHDFCCFWMVKWMNGYFAVNASIYCFPCGKWTIVFYEFVEVSVVAVSPVAFLSSKSLCGSLWAHSAQRGTGPLSETRRGGCCKKVYQRDSVETESSLMLVFFELISLTLDAGLCCVHKQAK